MRKYLGLILIAAACGGPGGEGFGGGSRITVADQMSAVADATLFVEMSDAAGICGHEQQNKVKAGSKRLTFEFGDQTPGTFTVWDTGGGTQPTKWVKVTFEQFGDTCSGSETGGYTGTVTLSAVGATVTGTYDVSFHVLSGSDQVEKGNINAATCDLSAAAGSRTCI